MNALGPDFFYLFIFFPDIGVLTILVQASCSLISKMKREWKGFSEPLKPHGRPGKEGKKADEIC